MICVFFKFSVTPFCALWTSVQTHSQQNLVAQKFFCIALAKKCMQMGIAVLKTVLRKLECEKKSNLLNSCVAYFITVYSDFRK